jgi:hypothetical protein
MSGGILKPSSRGLGAIKDNKIVLKNRGLIQSKVPILNLKLNKTSFLNTS